MKTPYTIKGKIILASNNIEEALLEEASITTLYHTDKVCCLEYCLNGTRTVYAYTIDNLKKNSTSRLHEISVDLAKRLLKTRVLKMIADDNQEIISNYIKKTF